MSGVTVKIDDRLVLRAINSIIDAAANPSNTLSRIGAVATDLVRLGFDNSTDPYGRPWKPVLRAGGQPLRDTGNLANSWTYAVRGDAVAVGSNLTVTHDGRSHNLAAIHQHGATIRPVKAKALRFMLNGKMVTAKKTVIRPRKMLPEGGWPNDWRDDVLEIVKRDVGAAFL